MRLILFISLAVFIVSCSSKQKLAQSNEDFALKYKNEIKKINDQRRPDLLQKNEVIHSTPPTTEEVIKEIASKVEYFPYSDLTKIGDAPRQEILPNREVYQQNKIGDKDTPLPPNMFDVSYNLNLYPAFRKIGAEFDAINVPPADAFGVPTALSNKGYLLAGNNSLQRAIDSTSSRSESDIEISRMLVQEKKKMQRQEKTQKIFGEPEKVTTETKIKKSPETQVKEAETPPPSTVKEKFSGFVKSIVSKDSSNSQKK